jgi:hypothetical protein
MKYSQRGRMCTQFHELVYKGLRKHCEKTHTMPQDD